MKTKSMVLAGLLIAMSVVGSMIKIPAITGTPALDSAPAFIGGVLLGPLYGALIGFLGHMATAMNSGFPLSLPVHLLIGAEMMVIVAVFAWLYRKNKIAAYVVALLLNGLGSPASFVPMFGAGFFFAMVVPLSVATAVNLLVTAVTGEVLVSRGLSVHE